MTMTPAEIAKSYREAKNRRVQIGVLADLNACKKPDILAALVEAGELTPEDAAQLQPKKPGRSPRQTPTPEPEELDHALAEAVEAIAEQVKRLRAERDKRLAEARTAEQRIRDMYRLIKEVFAEGGQQT